MGIFSKKKTFVESFTMKMVEDTPNHIQQSVLTSVVKGRPIANDLMANVLNGLAVKSNAYYRYGRDHFTNGLPEGHIEYAQATSATVQLVIESIVGEPVVMECSVYGAADGEKFATEHLLDNRGWNQDTDVITNPPFDSFGQTVYLEYATVVQDNLVTITYSYLFFELGEWVTKYETEDIVVLVLSNKRYYHASYLLNDITYYWFYTPDGTYPTLDVATDEELNSPYFPIVPLRDNKVDLTADKDTDLYKTSKKLLKRLGLDMDELATGINENPDVGHIDNAHIILGIQIQEDSLISKRYLYHHFKYLQGISKVSKADFDRWDAKGNQWKEVNTPPMNQIVIEDGSYRTEIGYGHITSEIKVGVLPDFVADKGRIGKYTTRDTTLVNRVAKDGYAYERSYMTFKHQVSATHYEEVIVTGLIHINYPYRSWTIDTTLQDSMTEDFEGFAILLNKNVLANISIFDRGDLMFDAMNMTLTSVVTQKLKWYQTGFFKFVAIVVSIAITIYSLGTMSETLYWAAGLVGSSSVIVGAIVVGVLSIALQYGINLLVDVIGVELAFIIAIIAAGFGVYGGTQGAPWADMMLQMQSGIQKGISNTISEDMKELMGEWDRLQDELRDFEKDIDDATALMKGFSIDPMALVDSSIALASVHETPDEYYFTRIHSGNIGPYAFSAAQYYVQDMLTLPDITDSTNLK
jgi:hypothetical protein